MTTSINRPTCQPRAVPRRLFEALDAANRLKDLADALQEAWGRSEAWRYAIQAGMGYMPRTERAATAALFRDLGINHEVQ